jgi:hypothetical protein
MTAAFGAAWRILGMNRNALRSIGAAVVGLLIVAGCGAGTGSPAGTDDTAPAPPSSTTAPTPPPTPVRTPTPQPTPVDTTSWVSFSSDRFGYDMAIPPTWAATPATRDWSLEIDDEVTTGADFFVEPTASYHVAVQAFSAPVPAGMSNEDWIAQFNVPSGNCPLPPEEWEAITVDGQPAVFNPDACDASQAYVVLGDRVYRFSVWRADQQALLKAFLSTVRFHSDVLTEAPPSSSP